MSPPSGEDRMTPDVPTSNADAEAAIELAEAERAVTLHATTAEQADGVARAARERTPRERRDAWRRRSADAAPDLPVRAQAGGGAHAAARPLHDGEGRPRDTVAATASVMKDPRAAVAVAATAALLVVLALRRRRR